MSDDPAPRDAPDPESARPRQRIADVWEDVVDDMEATAAEYRDRGWTVATVHPGDVTALDGAEGGRWGLDVLAPGDEFETVEELVAGDRSFDESEVYRAELEDLVVMVVAMLDGDTEHAVLFPAYYDVADATGMLDRARETGEIRTHLRPLDQRAVVTFRHADVELFLPGGD